MKNKISYKLVSLILLISFIITSISVYIQIQNQYANITSRFENSLNNIKKNQIPVLSQALWNVDYTTVDTILKNLLSNETIIYAQVIENGKNLKQVGKIKEIDIIKKEFDMTKVEDSQTYKIGKLIVIADLEPMYKDLQKTVTNIIVTEIIKILLISFLIIVIMKKLLTDPLEKLADYAKNLSLENLNKPLEMNKIDKNISSELTTVGNSINTMRINLIKQIKEGEEQNNILVQQSKLAAMGEMIGNIAHQWRQPLSLITTSASGLKLNYKLGLIDENKIDDYTDKIMSSANYLSDTINDFRDFFKPNREKEVFKLIHTFEKTFTLLNTQFTTNNIGVIKNIGDIEIYGFENELVQVFINIFNNAKDILLEKKVQKPLIFIDAFLKEDTVNISIKDNAGGVDDKILDKIFEPYFTTKHQSKGTGIGLYMSGQIIEKHMDGSLFVKNVDFKHEDIRYQGAKFIIAIPTKISLS